MSWWSIRWFVFQLKVRLFLGFYNDSLYPFALSIAICWICSPLFVTSLCVISTNCCKAALPKNRNKEFAKDYQQHNMNNILSNSRHRLFYMLLPLFVDCSNINAVSVVLKESPSFWRALNISNLWKFAVSSVKFPIFKSRSTYKHKDFWKCMRIAPIQIKLPRGIRVKNMKVPKQWYKNWL